jgi:hypothetical protein
VPRFRRTAAVAIVSLTTLAACGGGGGEASKSAAPAPSTTSTTAAPTPLDLVLASSDKVANISTMRFAMTFGTPDGSLTADGVMDVKGPRMSMTMDMASMLPAAARQAGTKVSMVLTDQAMYMQYPGIAAANGGKGWLRVDLASLGENNPLAPMIEQMRDADPSQNVAFLEGAQDVTTVGVEDVRGVPTTHYTFTIDLQKASAAVPENFRKFLSEALAELGSPLLPGDVWLDADGLPRRMSYEMSMTPKAGAAPMKVRVGMEMFDFGQPVSITPPPDNDVVDAGSLFGAGDEDVDAGMTS